MSKKSLHKLPARFATGDHVLWHGYTWEVGIVTEHPELGPVPHIFRYKLVKKICKGKVVGTGKHFCSEYVPEKHLTPAKHHG